MKITIDVKLPEKSSILVKVGEKVDQKDPIASVESHSAPIIIQLAKMLKVNPQKIIKYMTVSSDSPIKKDDVIALKKGML